MTYTLGLDIGIGSIGWAVINQQKGKLEDMGVRIFESAGAAQDARLNRGARRNLRRKNWRKRQLKDAFVDYGIISREELKRENYLSYTANTPDIPKPKYETVHHLRAAAIREKVSKREIMLALYNICQTRGHFLMENIDFSHESISYDLFKERFYSLVEPYVDFVDTALFEEKILSALFNNKRNKQADLKRDLKIQFTTDDTKEALDEIVMLLGGFKVDIAKIDEELVGDITKKVNVLDLLKKEELNDFLNDVVELHDLIQVHHVLDEYDYICDLNVQKLDEIPTLQKKQKEDPDEYSKRKKEIQEKMNVKTMGEKLRVIRNIENSFPNGLYVKEAAAILNKQKEFYPEITEEFIEVCSTIISARIPYYIGPLSEDAKNSWLKKNGNFKYSYDYSKSSVDEIKTIQNWKKAMISRCTYLPDEFALPKGSFLAEIFSIVNELNILNPVDQNGEVVQLSMLQKVEIINKLFIHNNTEPKYSDVANLLHLYSFGTKNGVTDKKFNNKITLYKQIVKILPSLEIKNVFEIFDNKDKINTLEDIILNINLFDEEVSKKKYFMEEYHFNEDIAKKLSKLKVKGFYSFSKKFIMETGMSTKNESLLELLFEDNTSEFTNEQMYRITNAVDTEGNPINFESNKYLKKLRDKNRLSVDLLIENGKPFIPVSRPVIRSLNECFKLYEEIIKTYGVPNRVVIETARDLKDSSRTGEVPARHFDQMKSCYDFLTKQIKEQKNKSYRSNLEEWDDIEQYLQKNKRKVELYIRQNGSDMISGEKIDINHLEQYEIDHILPRGFGDNSMDNLMLIHKNYNAKKQNRVPLEFIEQDGVKCVHSDRMISSKEFKARCYFLHEIGMITEKKLNQLMLTSTENAMGFINRNIVDTRYIIRELMAILRAYNQVNEYDTHLVAMQSAFTTVYRNAFKIRKNRDLGDQHHAWDAATVAVTDEVLSSYYPHYDERGNNKMYHSFIEQIVNNKELQGEDKQSEMRKLDDFIAWAYKKTYGNWPSDNDSLITEIKKTRPLYSVKAEKSYTGKLFEATIVSPYDTKRIKSVLDLFEINNDKRAYSAINCVAVDFYKYTDKKGNRKHLAVHIPIFLVDSQGNIDQMKYVRMIKEYYKVPELLEENGNLKEYCFRFRAYKNDLVYDTENQVIQKYNIGSITKKKLDLKHIYIFSQEEIYTLVFKYRKEMARCFDFKLSGVNPDGKKKFEDYDIQALAEYCAETLMDVEDYDRYKKTIFQKLSATRDYQSFLEQAAYLSLIVNRKCTWPSITGQYCPTANTVNGQDEYVKIKSSILGIRYSYAENGSLIINGPKKAPGKFSLIKKEPFSWKLSDPVVE